MDEWLDEELTLVGDRGRASRVLDQRMIREPIRVLNPRPPLFMAPEGTLAEAIGLMREYRVGCLLVVKDERLVGIITERDLLLKLDGADRSRPVRDLMTLEPEVLTLDAPIVYALNKMSVGGFRHVPLVDGDHRPVGVVSVKDIIDYIVDFFPNDVLTVPPDPVQGDRWHGRDGG
jgi:CBS domain-containing protein